VNFTLYAFHWRHLSFVCEIVIVITFTYSSISGTYQFDVTLFYIVHGINCSRQLGSAPKWLPSAAKVLRRPCGRFIHSLPASLLSFTSLCSLSLPPSPFSPFSFCSIPFPAHILLRGTFPLELGPLKSSQDVWRCCMWAPPAGSGAEPQPKSNFVHFSVKIWHLVATILTNFLRINRPNSVLEMREILVMWRVSGRWLQNEGVSREMRETW